MTTTKPDRTAFLRANTPAEAAKVLGHTDGGKKLRARLRSMGVRVSEDRSAFNSEAKGKLWAAFVEGKEVAAKATKKKPKAKASRKGKAETPAETSA